MKNHLGYHNWHACRGLPTPDIERSTKTLLLLLLLLCLLIKKHFKTTSKKGKFWKFCLEDKYKLQTKYSKKKFASKPRNFAIELTYSEPIWKDIRWL